MRFFPVFCALLASGGCSLAIANGAGIVVGPTAPNPAQDTAAATAPLSQGEIKAMRDFKLLDFNGDGKISRAEVALFPRLAGAFDGADTNHDNYLSYEEVRAYAIRYRAARDRDRAAQAAADTKP